MTEPSKASLEKARTIYNSLYLMKKHAGRDIALIAKAVDAATMANFIRGVASGHLEKEQVIRVPKERIERRSLKTAFWADKGFNFALKKLRALNPNAKFEECGE